MAAACYFAQYSDRKCSDGKHEWRSVAECQRDVKPVFKNSGIPYNNESEIDVILFNSMRLYKPEVSTFSKLQICTVHRDQYGTRYFSNMSRATSCRLPTHMGNIKPDRGLGMRQLIDIEEVTGERLPLGAKICKDCKGNKLPKLLERAAEPPVHVPSPLHVQEAVPEPMDVTETAVALPIREAKEKAIESITEIVVEMRSSQNSPNSSQAQSQSSQGSVVCSQQLRDALDILNTSMTVLAEHSKHKTKWDPIPYPLGKSIVDCSRQTKWQFTHHLKKATDLLADVINPGSGEELVNLCFGKQIDEKHQSVVVEQQIGNLIAAYNSAPTALNRKWILSLMAGAKNLEDNTTYLYTKEDLRQMLNISKFKVDDARSFAKEHGLGVLAGKDKTCWVRFDLDKADHVLDFIIDHGFVRSLAYGDSIMKFDTGAKEPLGGLIQMQGSTHIIQTYEKYCESINFSPLNTRTLLRIMERVVSSVAKKSKALSCLDNITENGKMACETIKKALDSMQEAEIIDAEKCNELKTDVENLRRYLSTDHISHVMENGSECADHCRFWGLSDAKNPKLQSKCEHEHDLECSSCQAIRDLFEEMNAILMAEKDSDLLEDLQYDMENAQSAISKWIGHIMAGRHQDRARAAVLDSLTVEKALLIGDWGMKIPPRYHREKQSDWYSKRGMSVDDFAVITRNEDGDLEKCSYLYFLDSCTQNTDAVLAIMDQCLQEVKKDFPKVKKLYGKFDNAGAFYFICMRFR